MKLHFVNSATVGVRSRLVNKGGSGRIDLNVRYGILEHPELGPIIIDAGYAPRVVKGLRRSLPLQIYGAALRPKIIESGNPGAALGSLGYKTEDVKHVVLTHLHADHVGYLDYFNGATIHLSNACADIFLRRPGMAALRSGVFSELLPKGMQDNLRSFEKNDLQHIPEGLGDGRDIFGDRSCLTVALPGHAKGHCGLYFPQIERPMLYAVDASWSREALLQNLQPEFPSKLVADNHTKELMTAIRIRRFAAGGGHFALCHETGRTHWDITSTFTGSPHHG